jgi:hypothetical protein
VEEERDSSAEPTTRLGLDERALLSEWDSSYAEQEQLAQVARFEGASCCRCRYLRAAQPHREHHPCPSAENQPDADRESDEPQRRDRPMDPKQ